MEAIHSSLRMRMFDHVYHQYDNLSFRFWEGGFCFLVFYLRHPLLSSLSLEVVRHFHFQAAFLRSEQAPIYNILIS